MGYSIGYDSKWKRDIGYGVPAYCDHPGCDEEIDRGMGWQCESEKCGCKKYYCATHLYSTKKHTHDAPPVRWHPDWRDHVLSDASWAGWRRKNKAEVEKLRAEQSRTPSPGAAGGGR